MYEQAARYREAVIRMTGEEEIVPPGFVLEVDREESRYLKRENWWSFGLLNAAPGAGIFGGVGVLCPLPPAGQQATVLTIVRRIWNKDPTNDCNIYVDRKRTVATVAGQFIQTMDARAPAQTYAQAVTKVVGVQFAPAFAFSVLAATAAQVGLNVTPDEWFAVLRPGDQLIVENQVANVQTRIAVIGYDRLARREEVSD